MQQNFYIRKTSKSKVDTSYQEVNYELNQNIRIEQSLSEMKYEVNSDSQEYKETAEREVQKTNYRSRRCIKMDDKQSYFRRNGCFYKRKSKLDNHSYQEKLHSGKFKLIRIKSDLKMM